MNIKKACAFYKAMHLNQINQKEYYSISVFRDEQYCYGFIVSGPIHLKSSRTTITCYVFDFVNESSLFGAQHGGTMYKLPENGFCYVKTFGLQVGATDKLTYILACLNPPIDDIEEAINREQRNSPETMDIALYNDVLYNV